MEDSLLFIDLAPDEQAMHREAVERLKTVYGQLRSYLEAIRDRTDSPLATTQIQVPYILMQKRQGHDEFVDDDILAQAMCAPNWWPEDQLFPPEDMVRNIAVMNQ
jgi:hypothetical protein